MHKPPATDIGAYAGSGSAVIEPLCGTLDFTPDINPATKLSNAKLLDVLEHAPSHMRQLRAYLLAGAYWNRRPDGLTDSQLVLFRPQYSPASPPHDCRKIAAEDYYQMTTSARFSRAYAAIIYALAAQLKQSALTPIGAVNG